MVRRLVREWLTASKTQQIAPDSVTAPLVDYLEEHGTPRERARALILHGMGLERRDNAADALLAYQKALRLARQAGDSTQVLLCWMRLGELYYLRTDLRSEAAEAYGNAMSGRAVGRRFPVVLLPCQLGSPVYECPAR